MLYEEKSPSGPGVCEGFKAGETPVFQYVDVAKDRDFTRVLCSAQVVTGSCMSHLVRFRGRADFSECINEGAD